MRLNKTHRAVIELLLEGNMSIAQIAESVKKSRKTIHNWMNDDDFRAELEEREADYKRTIKARISHMASKALKTQEEIMDGSKNDKARADVASDVLDRAGYIKLKASDIDKHADNDQQQGGIVILSEVEDESEVCGNGN